MESNRTERFAAGYLEANEDVQKKDTDTRERRCYTVEDLQKILLCGRRTVYDLLKRKEFSGIKTVNFSERSKCA